MANVIIPKRSSTASAVPAAGSLQIGEIAINLTDKKLYAKDSGGNVVQIGGGAGASVTVADTPPSSPSSGDTWYDSANGISLVWYGTQWVEDSLTPLNNDLLLPDMNGGTASTTLWNYSIDCGGAA